MKTLGNIIWLICAGIWMAISWFILGVLLCITIIGIPFGKQCFKIANFSLMPMGKNVTTNFDKHPIMNIIWIFLFGWEMAVGFVISGIILCVLIITIPFGLQCFKLVPLALMPFGSSVSK